MKVNGPAIGHEVTSLDPADAKTATARQEVEKINLAFEMGNNVMLYLDDIQHTSSELLQKFISLCDGQRKIEGVWKGQSRTYDLRGKKFCVVMAGNPYTETGTRFQIPDMLANRADTYNLGDILGGAEELFASSYLENALTSNSVIAPLATRDPGDVQKLVRLARGEDVPLTELSHGYSAAEVEEITSVLSRMMGCQKVLLEVNKQYIASASQEDAYRTEPGFKLQGSYRNMNKLAEKVVSAMNEEELQQLIDDHYASESQTKSSDDVALGPYLAKLDEAIRALGKPSKVELRVDDGTSAAAVSVVNVAREHAKTIERVIANLADLAKNGAPGGPTTQRIPAPQPPPMRRSAPPGSMQVPQSPPGAQFGERIEELIAVVRRLEHRIATVGGGSVPRFDVSLGASSPSNFYRGLEGDDVVMHGGVFVATYAKLPPIGAAVILGIELPGGNRFEVAATFAWTQDVLGEDSPAGFGARLASVPEDARAMIAQFVRHREPLVRE
jgi:hypothetical protein